MLRTDFEPPKEFMKCRLDNFSMGFILLDVNLSRKNEYLGELGHLICFFFQFSFHISMKRWICKILYTKPIKKP